MNMVANTGQTAPDDEWLSQVIDEILEPDLAIIDSHPVSYTHLTLPTNREV